MFLKKNGLNIYFISLILVKILLVGNFPLLAFGPALHDDGLMIKYADSILEGHWLGSYSEMTLIKGVFFPLFLNLCYFSGIPFTIAQILYYAGACLIFTWVVNQFVKNKILCAILFTILYFDPVSNATYTFARAYRCNLSPAQILYLISFYMGLYLAYVKEKSSYSKLLWSLGAGISLAAIWNTREDGIWVLPFVFTITLLLLGSCLTRVKKEKMVILKAFGALSWIAVPLLIFSIANFSISLVNHYYYGTFVQNELTGGNFPRMIKAIYSVQPDEFIFRTSVPKSTINKLYEVSPSFNELKPILEQNYGSGWDAIDGNLDGQIRDGWFFWCMRDVLAAKGYYKSAQLSENISAQIAEEIETALKDGRLKKRDGIVMPSGLMSPYRPSYFIETLWGGKKAVLMVAKYDDMILTAVESVGTAEAIRVFEKVTLNHAIYPVKHMLKLTGWLALKDDYSPVRIEIQSEGRVLSKIDNIGEKSDALKIAFDVSRLVPNNSKMQLVVFVNDTENSKIPLNQATLNLETKDFTLHYDYLNKAMEKDPVDSKWAYRKVNIVNKIIDVYKHNGIIGLTLGLLCYLFITAILIVNLKSSEHRFINEWIMLSSLIGSFVVLALGISYTNVTAFPAFTTMYLSAGYPLLNAFSTFGVVIVINYMWQIVVSYKVKTKS